MRSVDHRVLFLPSMSGNEEQDVRAFAYVKHTVLETLAEYVITPFKDALTNKSIIEQMQNGNLDTARCNNGQFVVFSKFNFEHYVGDYVFNVLGYPVSNISHSSILAEFRQELQDLVRKNEEGIVRRGVRKTANGVFAVAASLVHSLERLKAKHSGSPYTDFRITICDRDNQQVPYDETIDSLTVRLDPAGYRHISPDSAVAFFKAKSLEKRAEAFKEEFRQAILQRFGDSLSRGDRFEWNYDLSDKSGVRYLLSGRESIQYAEVLKALSNSESLRARSTGDLVLVRDLSFEDEMFAKKDSCGSLRVATVESDAGPLLSIARQKGDEVKLRQYHVLKNNGMVFVSLNDVLSSIDKLSEEFKNIDHVPSPPVYSGRRE